MSNGNGHHWSKFCWKDWSSDKALHPCSLAAKGFWIEMLCIMHEAKPIGYLTLAGKPATIRQMAGNAQCSEKEAKKYLAELEEAGVFSREPDGTIYSRRMVKDAELAETSREWGKAGGNPQLKRKKDTHAHPSGGVNPPLNPRVNREDNRAPYGEGLRVGLNLESDTDSELEERKEKQVSNNNNLLSFPSPAREAEPTTAQRIEAQNRHRKVASELNADKGERLKRELFKDSKLDRWDQAKLMAPNPGPKHLTPEQLAVARKLVKVTA